MTKKSLLSSALAIALVLCVSAVPVFAASAAGSLTVTEESGTVAVDPNAEVINIDGTADCEITDEMMEAMLGSATVKVYGDGNALATLNVTEGIAIDEDQEIETINIDGTSDCEITDEMMEALLGATDIKIGADAEYFAKLFKSLQ